MVYYLYVTLCLLQYVHTPNLPTNIVDFRGFASSIILIERDGILMSIGNFPQSLTQAMLVGTMLVGGLGISDIEESWAERFE